MFKITNITLVGEKVKKYPVEYCCYCRGLLAQKCFECEESNKEKAQCTVSSDYHHVHCEKYYTKNQTESVPNPTPKGNKNVSESEDDESPRTRPASPRSVPRPVSRRNERSVSGSETSETSSYSESD